MLSLVVAIDSSVIPINTYFENNKCKPVTFSLLIKNNTLLMTNLRAVNVIAFHFHSSEVLIVCIRLKKFTEQNMKKKLMRCY